MSRSISELTYKIVAFPEIQQANTDECIDWAIEMLELGYESPTLSMLASLNKPTNYFEVIDYVVEVIQELGLEMKSGDDAIISYASYYVHQIAKGKSVKENLTRLYEFCQKRDYEDLLHNFNLLYWAWDTLDYGDTEYNHYWEAARINNIEQIVVSEAKKWINENMNHFVQNSI